MQKFDNVIVGRKGNTVYTVDIMLNDCFGTEISFNFYHYKIAKYEKDKKQEIINSMLWDVNGMELGRLASEYETLSHIGVISHWDSTFNALCKTMAEDDKVKFEDYISNPNKKWQMSFEIDGDKYFPKYQYGRSIQLDNFIDKDGEAVDDYFAQLIVHLYNRYDCRMLPDYWYKELMSYMDNYTEENQVEIMRDYVDKIVAERIWYVL